MKFSEYLASFITPQMTLLEKFNAMCKFLSEEYKELYKHTISLRFGDSYKTLVFINTSDVEYNIAQLNNPTFFDNKLNTKISGDLVITVDYRGYNVLIFCPKNSDSPSLASLSLENAEITNQSCVLYEN